jgi:hypothetical protein
MIVTKISMVSPDYQSKLTGKKSFNIIPDKPHIIVVVSDKGGNYATN